MIGPMYRRFSFFVDTDGKTNKIGLEHVTSILDTHEWKVSSNYARWECKLCGATIMESGEEVYFFSDKCSDPEPWKFAEYPIDCKTNTIKQVIQ